MKEGAIISGCEKGKKGEGEGQGEMELTHTIVFPALVLGLPDCRGWRIPFP